MPQTEVVFSQEVDKPCPFLLHLINYKCDGKEGIVLFEGHYHINNTSEGPYEHCLPQTINLFARTLEDIPTLIVSRGDMSPIHQEYRVLTEHIYTVEIYKTIQHTNYTHLNRISIYFRILNKESS
jgi:hypothetical protein